MRILGIDIGSKRTGIAISDELGITAQGLNTIESEKDLISRLKDIIKSEGVNEVVIGLPLNMNGSAGPQAEKAIKFCDLLKEEISIPVKLWDERMTTVEVERVMIEADISRHKRKKKIDKLAAQVMLQSYLNSQTRHCEERSDEAI
ncbi:MAG: Holliday junction resolvase RuvX [Candidatus Omnitrophica bacterium]|nr:Holliday junction resolvase RuvX [Candidatus Omnitrophota bacterium]